ncbi:hypothetical protein HB848_13730 [Listeria rocourtiae]|uniref:hypothetical protein n=1 Tax=Listeria rocourtiae TaxID=647910 RepID=UPI001625BB9D|nr:hypothetical protein [Listeria rocourtiae]MBC1436396.1 hypothetical protein [Listeria rocourtiae]
MNYTKKLYCMLIIGLLLLLIFGGTYAAFMGLGLVYIVAILDDILSHKINRKNFFTKTGLLILGLVFLYFVLRFF